ncbi:MAG: Ig-like domain-containing protein [Terriglobales bacterium]
MHSVKISSSEAMFMLNGMWTGRKLPLTLAFAALLLVAFGAGCRGFFTGNSLVSVAVQPPTANILLNGTTTLQAWGTFQDNSRSQITSGVAWSSSDPTTVSIDETSGVATGLQVGTATVTAASQGLTGTASATVYIVISSLKLNYNTWTFTGVNGGTSPGFVVTANGTTDVTTGATFLSSNTTYINCVNGTDPVYCTASSGTPAGPYTITVSYTGSSLTLTINVTAS